MTELTSTMVLNSRRPLRPRVPSINEFEDESPFGLGALARNTIQILKPSAMGQLAFNLAMQGTRKQIQDDQWVEKILAQRPDWLNEFQIVRLIEKSIWIQGQSDLVMTMTKNPSQIPDNPPPEIMNVLAKAYGTHPDATTWFGVPLFSDHVNEQGLPIPMTAAEVRKEHQDRLRKVQAHALRWRWFYRSAMKVPMVMDNALRMASNSVKSTIKYRVENYKQWRTDVKARKQAKACQQIEYYRTGRCISQLPAHKTRIGELVEGVQGLSTDAVRPIFSLTGEATDMAEGMLNSTTTLAGLMSVVGVPLYVGSMIATVTPPIMVISCDPFLFCELPREEGKLRFVGHWYWQRKSKGEEVLHLHI
ncbi:hypothetical protein SH668x_003347 [Planctomicrobium sp. SH668]|uniref:hypothetical protein n=1 Tax=Planctomicrobium sp. SH668 TaxID=3448126 RepID=UPI003F5B8FF5